MHEHLAVLRMIAFAGIATMSCAAPADTVTEVEPNDTVTSAQMLKSSTSDVVVSGFIGSLGSTTNDVDFYTFYANKDDVLTIDIDNGIGGAQSIDLYLAVFDPQDNYKILREDDDADLPLDSGSISTWDPRIDNFVAPATGFYVIGVTSAERPFLDGGNVSNVDLFGGNGDYTLIVTGLQPTAQPVPDPVSVPAKQVTIKVRPGQHGVLPLSHEANGRLPVAILSSDSFDPMKIDESTLTFGRTGNETALMGCNSRGKDFNGDGLPDKLCHFDIRIAGFQPGDLEGILRGKMSDGVVFEGHGRLKVAAGKRHEHVDGRRNLGHGGH